MTNFATPVSPAIVSRVAITSIRKGRPLVGDNNMTFVLYRSGFEYRWRLRATNGRIIADSGEGYFN